MARTNMTRIALDVLERFGLYAEYRDFDRGDKTLFRYPRIAKKKPIFTVIITFLCNINCTYCQFKGLERECPRDMDLQTFDRLLRWLARQDIRYLRFMGGEVSIHPDILEYIRLLKKRRFTIRYFANILYPPELLRTILDSMPPRMVERFIIHYKDRDWYDPKQHALFKKNFAMIARRGYTIHLRHNLESMDTRYDYCIELMKRYRVRYFTSIPLFPGATDESVYSSIDEWKRFIPLIIDIYKKCKEAGIKYDFTRPIPPCFLTKEDYDRYYHRFIFNPCLKGISIFRPMVYPDLRVCFCPGLHSLRAPKPLIEYKDWQEVYSFLSPTFKSLQWEPLYPSCTSCSFYIQKRCQGLCVAVKGKIAKGKCKEANDC